MKLSDFEHLSKKWIEEKIIDTISAKKMRDDIRHFEAEQSSGKWTLAISLIGALSLGIALFAFFASNWEELSRFQKIFLGIFAVLSSFWGGLFLEKKFPKVGSSLIFLAAFGIGAVLALISQVYHLDGPPWGLLALWAFLIAPLPYFIPLARPVFSLLLVVSFLSLLLFLGKSDGFELWDIVESLLESFSSFLLIFPITLFLFIVGNIHEIFHQKIFAEKCRLLAVKVALFFLFWMTFSDISGGILEESHEEIALYPHTIWYTFGIFALTILGYALLWKKRPFQENILFALFFLTSIAFFFPFSTHLLFLLWVNILFAGSALLLLFEGFRRQNLRAVNFAFFAIGAFLFGKYIDLFSGWLEPSLFFLTSGIVLLAGGMFAEKKRRALIETFSQKK